MASHDCYFERRRSQFLAPIVAEESLANNFALGLYVCEKKGAQNVAVA